MAKPNKKAHKAERVADQSRDMREELIATLHSVVPEAFTEGRLDLDKLRQHTDTTGDDKPERFSFTWSAKRDAIALLQLPTRATLCPDSKNSVRSTKRSTSSSREKIWKA